MCSHNLNRLSVKLINPNRYYYVTSNILCFCDCSVFSRANLWIGGDLIFTPSIFDIRGSVDLYAGVPRIDKVVFNVHCFVYST